MMSPETPQQTEERLQRYAKERRAQGGAFALHPATRRLLQDEVRRQHGPAVKARPGWGSWLGLWRNGLVIGGGVAAAVLLATWMFRDSPLTPVALQLAQNEISLNPRRLMEAEKRVDELRDEANKTTPEIALAKAKPDFSDNLTRQNKETLLGAAPKTGSLTPVSQVANDSLAASDALNLSQAPARGFYANGAEHEFLPRPGP